MRIAILILGVTYCLKRILCTEVGINADSAANTTNPQKDMYVLHATVYQVGILTNKTDNMADDFKSNGNQESITFYHSNGTNIDFSAIPKPFLTNITAQSLVGVVPVSQAEVDDEKLPTGITKKRSLDHFLLHGLFKRDAISKTSDMVQIPSDKANVSSISLPFLLSLSNMTNIRVPIPTNTSVVHYTKVNTLIQKPLNVADVL